MKDVKKFMVLIFKELNRFPSHMLFTLRRECCFKYFLTIGTENDISMVPCFYHTG